MWPGERGLWGRRAEAQQKGAEEKAGGEEVTDTQGAVRERGRKWRETGRRGDGLKITGARACFDGTEDPVEGEIEGNRR